MHSLKILFETSRPISWVNTAYPFGAGHLLLGGSFDLVFWIGVIFFLIPYNLMMYGINDVYDYESDMRNPRKGGIEGAVTHKKYHSLIINASIWTSLPFVLALGLLGSFQSAIVLAVIVFFVVAYSVKGLRFKEVPVLDSVTSSMHFVGPLLFAFSLMPSVPMSAWIIALAFFLWGMASQAFGSVQDIIPDRQAKINSIGTVLGARKTMRLSFGLYLLASILIIGLMDLLALVAGLAALVYAANLLPYLNMSDDTSANSRKAWRRFMWLNYAFGAVVTICLLLASLR